MAFWLRSAWALARKEIDIRDALLGFGLLLLFVGLAQVSLAAAFAAPGAILVAVAVFVKGD